MADFPSPATLGGTYVRIEPLGLEHVEGLAAATAGDEEVWRWLPAFPADEPELRALVEAALADRLVNLEEQTGGLFRWSETAGLRQVVRGRPAQPSDLSSFITQSYRSLPSELRA